MNFKITNGSISFGADTILESINFEVKGKEKVAIVGRNGSGKSTLMRSIVDNSMLEEGNADEKFSIYKEGIYNIGYLKQMDFEDNSISMIDEILKVYDEVISVKDKMEETLKEMESNKSEEIAKKYSKLHDRFEMLDGYTYKKEYEVVIKKFGFSEEDKLKKLSEFSGGQRTKIAFIKLLLSKPDLLLLDEPTNHLDIETIEWLEDYLKNYPKAVVLISHDRMFINKIVDKVYEIEYGETTYYGGNYDFFEKQKRVNYERALKDYEYQQKEIKRLTALVDRFRYKKNKAKMAQAKLKQIERMVKLEEPNRYDLKSFNTNFKIQRESGRNVLHVKDLAIGYSDVIKTVSFDLYKGRKLGVIGANGTGKSTLLKTIVNRLSPISGQIKIGHNVDIGYFDQELAFSDSNKTVFDDFSEDFPDLTVTEVRSSLANFMFYGEDVFKTINMLSGGEKVRLELSHIFKKGSNLLVLDEPTNHMDIVGKESLESMLKEYKGTVIFVSHDRYFVNKIADSLLIFQNDLNEVQYFDGNYSEYLEKKNKESEEYEPDKAENNKAIKKVKYDNPLREKGKLEKKIKKLEEKIEEIEKVINNLKEEIEDETISSNYIKLQEINDEILKYEDILNESYLEWDRLNEEYNSIIV